MNSYFGQFVYDNKENVKKKNNNTWIDTSILDLQVHTYVYDYFDAR